MQKVTRELYILNGKEYTLSEIDQLRNEFVYLSETVEKLLNDKERLEWSKKALNDEISTINKNKDIEINSKEQSYLQMFNDKNKELSDRQSFVESEEKRLIWLLSEYNKIKEQIDIDTVDIISKRESFEKEHKEYMYKQYNIQKENEEKSKSLLLEKEEIKALKNSTNETLQENIKTIELYNKEKQQREKEKKLYSQELEELKKVKEYVNTALLELSKKENILKDKEKEIEKSLETETKLKEENKSYLSDIPSKEMDLMKKITEFQEEKYKFFMIMKQKWIKKNDLDQLEKDFNT